MERGEEAPRYGRVETVRIPGGNHAQFGDYGAQAGDGVATVVVRRTGESFRVRASLSERQRGILLAGGLMARR